MQAVVFEEFGGTLTLRDVPEPACPADGVVIQVGAAGLCRSDWHGWMGHDPDVKLPHVPGHEFAGLIETVGNQVTRFRHGDRVTVPFCVGCGNCEQCIAGHQQVCDHYYQPGFTGWGAFAERVAIPHADANLVHLPDDLSLVAAASLGCRFVTSYRAVVDQGQLTAGQWLAVHGCGGVGLAAIQIAVALGARVVAVDVNPLSLEWAQRLGAAAVVLSDATGNSSRAVVQQIRELTLGGAHVSLDAVGSLATCLQSLRSLRKRGCHVQVGLMVGEQRNAPLPMHIVIAHELKIVGSHGMSATGYPPLLELIRSGQLRPDRLVAREVNRSQLAELLPRIPHNELAGLTICVS